jgi:putative FmdB family regulatory protein
LEKSLPIYEYQCVSCGAVTDIKHGFKETTNEPCPQCGGSELKRLFKPAGIVFKGSGFYVTDSRKPEASGSSEGAKSDAPKSDGPKGDGPKSDGPKSETPKSDTPKSGSGGTGDAAA